MDLIKVGIYGVVIIGFIIFITITMLRVSVRVKRLRENFAVEGKAIDRYMELFTLEGLDRKLKKYSDEQILDEYKQLLSRTDETIDEKGESGAKSKFLEDEMDIRNIDYNTLLDEVYGKRA